MPIDSRYLTVFPESTNNSIPEQSLDWVGLSTTGRDQGNISIVLLTRQYLYVNLYDQGSIPLTPSLSAACRREGESNSET